MRWRATEFFRRRLHADVLHRRLTLPLKLAIIPLFVLMRDLGILNNQAALDHRLCRPWACRRPFSS
jgi:ABC-type glycerol-3-phosphate transport system permease component